MAAILKLLRAPQLWASPKRRRLFLTVRLLASSVRLLFKPVRLLSSIMYVVAFSVCFSVNYSTNSSLACKLVTVRLPSSNVCAFEIAFSVCFIGESPCILVCVWCLRVGVSCWCAWCWEFARTVLYLEAYFFHPIAVSHFFLSLFLLNRVLSLKKKKKRQLEK